MKCTDNARYLFMVIFGSLAIIIGFACVVPALFLPTLLSNEPKLSVQQLVDMLNVPLPVGAKDVVYESSNREGFFIRLTFKAAPADATAFSNLVCNGILHQGYNPFVAVQVDSEAPNAVLIQTDDFYYYYSASPNIPNTFFGNQCRERGLIRILVDKTNPQLYSVVLDIPRDCNVVTPSANCGGIYIIPHDLGSLVANAPPFTIEATAGKEISFTIPTEAGATYEAIVTRLSPTPIASNQNLVRLKVEPQSDTCCYSSTRGSATTSGLKLSFVGPKQGTSRLRIFWFGNIGTCTVQVRKVKL